MRTIRTLGMVLVPAVAAVFSATASASVIQISGASSVQEATIDASSSSTNTGSAGNITVRNHAVSNRTWGLLRFELPTLAPNEYISDAKITLQYFANDNLDPGSITINLNSVNYSWVENEVTWNSRSTGVRWEVGLGNIGWQDGSDPPANYDPASLGSVSLIVGDYGLKVFQSTALTALLDDMAQGITANNGFLLNPLGGPVDDNRYYFVSTERNSATPGEDFAPQLELTISTIPEPAGLGLIGIGALFLARRRRD